MKAYSELERQSLARVLWQGEKPVCQSNLVYTMMNEIECITFSNGHCDFSFSWHEVENLYPASSLCQDWDEAQCREWLTENVDDSYEHGDESLDELRDEITANDVPSEPLEWWLVTDWLADKLRAEGECILSNDYGVWWGRCCSGQSVILDGVIQRIAVEVLG